jgi:hypothetical protein
LSQPICGRVQEKRLTIKKPSRKSRKARQENTENPKRPSPPPRIIRETDGFHHYPFPLRRMVPKQQTIDCELYHEDYTRFIRKSIQIRLDLADYFHLRSVKIFRNLLLTFEITGKMTKN